MGGTFDVNISKKRPGTYINFVPEGKQTVKGSKRGTALLPLIGLGWGPDKGTIKLTAASPDAEMAKLGHSVYDDNDFMMLVRETFKGATTVVVYVSNPGTKATATAE